MSQLICCNLKNRGVKFSLNGLLFFLLLFFILVGGTAVTLPRLQPVKLQLIKQLLFLFITPLIQIIQGGKVWEISIHPSSSNASSNFSQRKAICQCVEEQLQTLRNEDVSSNLSQNRIQSRFQLVLNNKDCCFFIRYSRSASL